MRSPLTLGTPPLQPIIASSLLDPEVEAEAIRLGVVSEEEGSRRPPQTRYHARHTPFHCFGPEASAAKTALGSVPVLTQGLARYELVGAIFVSLNFRRRGRRIRMSPLLYSSPPNVRALPSYRPSLIVVKESRTTGLGGGGGGVLGAIAAEAFTLVAMVNGEAEPAKSMMSCVVVPLSSVLPYLADCERRLGPEKLASSSVALCW